MPYTNITSNGMSLKRAREVIHSIQNNYALSNFKSKEKEIGEEIKFLNFSMDIKPLNKANDIIKEIKKKYGLGYVDISRDWAENKAIKSVNLFVSIKIDEKRR